MLSCRTVMCLCMQNLKEGMGTVIEKLMSENVELTERFNEAVRGRPQCHAAAVLTMSLSAVAALTPLFMI